MRALVPVIAAVGFLLAPLAAGAEATDAETAQTSSSDLTSLMSADDAKGWEAVGRLNIGRSSMCTGALIAPRIVLTAAHCLYDTDTGDRVDPGQIEFLAGWRNGRAAAYRSIRRAIIHPKYEFVGKAGNLRVANDLALLELDSDIRLSSITPFKTASRPRKGAEVGVVSYARDRSERPALQKVCHVLARQSGSLILSCDVDFGSSGAPIFVEEDGEPRIVSVVSAKAMVRDRPVSLGTNLEKPLAELKELLASGDGVFVRSGSQVSAVSAQAAPRIGLAGGGAKFLKP